MSYDCNIEMKEVASPGLLSCFRKYSLLEAFWKIMVVWLAHESDEYSTSKGKGGEGEGREREGRGREGGLEGPPLWNPKYATVGNWKKKIAISSKVSWKRYAIEGGSVKHIVSYVLLLLYIASQNSTIGWDPSMVEDFPRYAYGGWG